MASVASSFAQNWQYDYSTLSNGLVAYYPFNGNFNDYSGNGNNLTNVTAGISFVTNRFGGTNRSAYISTSSDSAQSVNPIGITGNSSRTVSFWTSLNSSALPNNNSSFIVSFGNPQGPGSVFETTLRSLNGQNVITIGGDFADNNFNIGSNIFFNSWHQITCIYSGAVSGELVYIDGNAFTNGNWTNYFLTNILNTPSSSLYIGANPNIDSYGQSALAGASISDLRIYNRALSTNEVTALYTMESILPTQEQDDDVAYLAATIPTNQVFYTALAANTAFASDLASTITANPSICGLFVGPQGPQGPVGPQGPQGFQGQAGVGSPQNLLTNIAFLQALATNQVFLNALASNVLIASKALQTITFTPIPVQTFKPFKTITLNASSSAKLPITYTIANPAIGTIIGNVLQLQGSGSTTVTATQAGNQYYNPASASQSLIVK